MDFRVGDIVVSSMNIGPSWEVVRVNRCSYQLRLPSPEEIDA